MDRKELQTSGVTQSGPKSFWKSLGPGLLFAGAAVGVSHLVQSTRAGADFGFALLGFVLLGCLAKYPAFSFGPYYAAATGSSLVEAYRRQGRWALWLYLSLTIATMFAVQAAVTATTAGLAVSLSGGTIGTVAFSAIILALCTAVLGLGGFSWLNSIIRVMVLVLTVSTFAATLMVLPQIAWSEIRLFPDNFDPGTVFFIVALVGWMPSAIDISVWHSLWTLARSQQTSHRPSPREAMLDFNIGYGGTALLAVCFVVLGAAVMHPSGKVFADQAPAFAAQVVDLYALTLGEWSRPILGISALAIMFSTTLTVVDGFPRALAAVSSRLYRGPEEDGEAFPKRAYWGGMVVLAWGSWTLIGIFPNSLKGLVDLATTLSFLTAPILAGMNHRAVFGPDLKIEDRPPESMRWLSIAGMIFLGGFAVFYCWLRLST